MSGVHVNQLELDALAADPTSPPDGTVWYNSTDQQVKVIQGGFTVPVGGISVAQHRALDQLVHNLAEDAYQEIVRSSGQVADIIVWTDSGKTQKIRETNLTRTGGQVSSVVVRQYDGSGTLVETLTGTITRSSGQVASVNWVLT